MSNILPISMIQDVLDDLDILGLHEGQSIETIICGIPVLVQRVTEYILRTEHCLYLPDFWTVSSKQHKMYILQLYPSACVQCIHSPRPPWHTHPSLDGASFQTIGPPFYEIHWKKLAEGTTLSVPIDHLELACCYLIRT